MVPGVCTAIASNIQFPKYFCITAKQLLGKRVLSGMGYVRDGLCLEWVVTQSIDVPLLSSKLTKCKTWYFWPIFWNGMKKFVNLLNYAICYFRKNIKGYPFQRSQAVTHPKGI